MSREIAAVARINPFATRVGEVNRRISPALDLLREDGILRGTVKIGSEGASEKRNVLLREILEEGKLAVVLIISGDGAVQRELDDLSRSFGGFDEEDDISRKIMICHVAAGRYNVGKGHYSTEPTPENVISALMIPELKIVYPELIVHRKESLHAVVDAGFVGTSETLGMYESARTFAIGLEGLNPKTSFLGLKGIMQYAKDFRPKTVGIEADGKSVHVGQVIMADVINGEGFLSYAVPDTSYFSPLMSLWIVPASNRLEGSQRLIRAISAASKGNWNDEGMKFIPNVGIVRIRSDDNDLFLHSDGEINRAVGKEFTIGHNTKGVIFARANLKD